MSGEAARNEGVAYVSRSERGAGSSAGAGRVKLSPSMQQNYNNIRDTCPSHLIFLYFTNYVLLV